MTANDPTPSQRNAGLKTFLIVDTIGTVILAPLALFWGMMSVMASTTTTNAGWANLYALVNLSLPVAMVVCLIASWVLWSRRRDRQAWIAALLPIAWLVVSFAMMAAWPSS